MNLQQTLNLYGSNKKPFFFCISYDLKQWVVKPLDELDEDILFEFDKKANKHYMPDINIKTHPIPFKEYEKKFIKVKEYIKNGYTYLLNLTTPTKIFTNSTLEEIYQSSNAKFKLYFKNKFVCFSPERFVNIKNNKIYTYPMKGTIDASIPDAQAKILTDQKEMAEHTMAVDLLRNDLSILSKKVRVDKFRYIDKIKAGGKELLQVSSQISAELENNWQHKIGDIITSLLPAGSISGTPKKQTLKIIEEVEKYNRGFFTGIFGYFDGESLDSAVMIRFIEKDDDGNLIYKSGGGITSDSSVEAEYQEMIDKVYIPSYYSTDKISQ